MNQNRCPDKRNTHRINENYKNSYKSTEKELVSLSVYNVGYQKCDPLYQWGPGVRDHYLIHHIISGKGCLKVRQADYCLKAGDSFLVYPDTETSYTADAREPWEYAWVGFNGSDYFRSHGLFARLSRRVFHALWKRNHAPASAYL